VSEIVEGELMSFTVKGLTPNTNYYFKIQAKNAAGYGPFSPFTSIKTMPGIILISVHFYLVFCYHQNVLIHFLTFILGGLPYNDGTSLKGIVIEKKNFIVLSYMIV
jgi:neogenin